MFGKQPAGGFGAPATGGFGAPAAGGFGKAAAPAGGFGAPATGGFGAPAAGGFGAAPTVPAGGFGKAAAPAGGFGAAATGGFGAAATGGFGAAATGGFGAAPTAPAGGFGAPAAGGFGKAAAPAGGFGAPAAGGFGGAATGGFGAPATGGFGAAATGGFGAVGGMNQGNVQAPAISPDLEQVQYLVKQSAMASYLVELDHAYDALHAHCRFRSFVYNICGPGLRDAAVHRERYIASQHGGGPSDAQWMRALQENPDPLHMYPSSVHFSQEVLRRVGKQKEAIEVLVNRVEELLQDTESVLVLDAVNQAVAKEVQQRERMLRRRWLALLVKTETMARRSSGGEISGVGDTMVTQRISVLRHRLEAPGGFQSALDELLPYLEGETARSALTLRRSGLFNGKSRSTSSGQSIPVGGGRRGEMGMQTSSPVASVAGDRDALDSATMANLGGLPLLRSPTDPVLMKRWLQFTAQMQDGIEALATFVETHLGNMTTVRERLAST